MTKKLGPLPIWAWGLILGVAGYFLYERHLANQAANSSTGGTTGILDPNAVDPNTGLTYGEEESAALNANASLSAGTGGASTTESGAQGTVPATNEFTDFLSFLQDWNQFAQTLGWQSPTQAAANSASSTAQAAASSPPVQASSPPSSPASAHTNPTMAAATIDTHTGGPFYNWYESVYHRAPPSNVSPNAARYVAWTKGVTKNTAARIPYGSVWGTSTPGYKA